jgi:hypothetical protein
MTTYNRSASATSRRWEDSGDTYRSDWESRYGADRAWDEYGPAYRYGWESAGDNRFQGRQFEDAETDLQRDFSASYGRYRSGHEGHSVQAHPTAAGKIEHTWENFKDTVREGWDRARAEVTGNR